MVAGLEVKKAETTRLALDQEIASLKQQLAAEIARNKVLGVAEHRRDTCALLARQFTSHVLQLTSPPANLALANRFWLIRYCRSR